MDHTDLIDRVISAKHLLDHEFYQAWNCGELSSDDLKHYAEQYYQHVAAFPRYISRTHSLCLNTAGRRQLAENLAEEEGLSFGEDHPTLWRHFAEAMGADGECLSKIERDPMTAELVATFFEQASHSYARGLGALYAYEAQVPEIAETKIAGLRKFYGVTDSRALAFFEVHRKADIEHREVCRRLIDQLDESERQDAVIGAERATEAMWNFLSAMQDRRKAA